MDGMVVTLENLRHRREEILEIARRRGVRSVRVFGSIARGEASQASDIDLLVEFEPGRSLFDQVHLGADLEALLNVRVDVVPAGGLLPRDGHIIEEAIPL